MAIRDIDELLMSDWAMLNDSFIQQPPVDLLVAWYLNYKSPVRDGRNLREAGRLNADALREMPMLARKTQSFDQMPSFLKTPEKMALIAKMKAEMMGETTNG
jgi:hypothetical protein